MSNLVEGSDLAAPALGNLPPQLQATYAQLRVLRIFDGIPNQALSAAIATGGIERVSLARDVFVADPITITPTAGKIYFVSEGQVAAGVFDRDALTNRRRDQERRESMTAAQLREESSLQPEPLARLAKKNVALFMPGDLFNTKALAANQSSPVAFYTTAPTVVAVIAPETLAELAVAFGFFEARIRRAVQICRDRLRSVTGVKQEMLDFFVRQGISVSGESVRVRQLDRCIDCKQCEDACEDRFGSRRLTLGGYQLGMLDFVYTCRTCTDQRCIPPCEYDSIKYDEARGEVVINDVSCTGCTLCAQACPYGAIEMVDIEDPQNPTYKDKFRKRLELAGSLKSGPGTGRLARPRRIANKCDHCNDYREQACISACPTGSLVELSAYDLFSERWPASVALANSGYDQELPRQRKPLLPTNPFTKGVDVRDGGAAKMRRGKMFPVVLWGVALAVWFLCLVEILLRIYWPEQSLQYAMLDKAMYTKEVALAKIGYAPHRANKLSIWCGIIGTGLMFISAIYPMFRRFKMFRFIASNSMWFDFHMMAGVVGPMFIGLHCALKLDQWEAAAFWSMVIVVVSGVLGRYLYTQLPDLMNGRELEELDHERRFTQLRSKYQAATVAAETELQQYRMDAQRIADRAGLFRTLLWVIMQDVRRPGRWWSRRRRLAATGAPKHVRKELVRRTGRFIRIERRRVIGPQADLLLHSWKKVHVPFTIVLVAISAIHIYDVWEYAF